MLFKPIVNAGLVLLLLAVAQSEVASVAILRVTDEHGQSIANAKIILNQGSHSEVRNSDASGLATFSGLRPGRYRFTTEKAGFYTQSQELSLAPGRTEIQLELAPVREFEQDVQVSGQTSPVDPQQTASNESLSGRDILTIPYPATRDYRNVLPYIPGVVANFPGDLHVAGASTQESAMFLDGFEVSQPAAGSLQLRISPDATRLIEVENSRFPVQYGKSSGGILNIESQDADNHFRWNITNFIPSFQKVKGLNFDSWTPRAYVAGPLLRNKLWFFLAHLQENTQDLIKELPDGQDASRLARADDLMKLQWAPTARHSVSALAVINVSNTSHFGISKFDPASTTTNQHFRNLLVGLRDQIKLGAGNLLDIGIAYQTFRNTGLPLGTQPYVFAPSGREGNFFEASKAQSRRGQEHANIFLQPIPFYGIHQISAGLAGDQIAYGQIAERSDILFTDSTGALLRQVVFGAAPHFRQTVSESSAYLQDRWLATSRTVVEAGIRWDHDDLLRSSRAAPRIAASYLLDPGRELKISAGWGLYTARNNLDLLTRPQQGSRTDLFFQNGSPLPTLIQSMKFASTETVRLPQSANWSVGVQSHLFSHFYGSIGFLKRNMSDALSYSPAANGEFVLTNGRTEDYRAVQVSLEGKIAEDHRIALAYTRSRGVTNEVLEYSIENPVFGPQTSGRLPWDAPNHLTSWGSFRSFKWKTVDFGYSLLWRTGLPFVVVNSRDQLVETNRRRLPDYFSLNPAIEKRFSFRTYRLALRVGIDNITNNKNAVSINNNIDSPSFLEPFGKRHRTLNARIRLLGRK